MKRNTKAAQAKRHHAGATNAAPVGKNARQGAKAPQTRGASAWPAARSRPAALKLTPEQQARAIADHLKAHPQPVKTKLTPDEAIRQVRAKWTAEHPGKPLLAMPTREPPAPRAPTTKRTGKAHKDDRAAALAVLASVHVIPGSRYGDEILKQLASFFKTVSYAEAERQAAKAQEQREYQILARLLVSAELKTQSAQGLRDCFLHDLRGETPLPLSLHQAGLRPVPYLNPQKPKRGRPPDVAVRRTIRDFADVWGLTWQACAAGVFLMDACTGADSRDYRAIMRRFRDGAREIAQR